MKSSYLNKQIALKTLLLAVVGANFAAHLQLSETGRISLSAENEAPNGEVAQTIEALDDRPHTAPATSPGAAKVEAAAATLTRNRSAQALRGHTPLTPDAAPRPVTPPTTTAPAPPPVAAAPTPNHSTESPQPSEITICADHRYVLSYKISIVNDEPQTQVMTRTFGASNEEVALSTPAWKGNANDPATRLSYVNEVKRQLKALPANIACAIPDETRARVRNCEIAVDAHGSERTLSETAAFECSLARLQTIGSENPRLHDDELNSAIEAMVANLKSGLKAIASGNCDHVSGRGESLCRSGELSKLKDKIERSLNNLKHLRDVNKGRVDKLIASVRGVIAAGRAQRVAEQSKKDADRLKERISDTQKQIKETQAECQRDARQGLADPLGCASTLADLSEDLRQLRADRLDQFADTYRGGSKNEFQNLLDQRDGMDRQEFSSLLNETRNPFLAALRGLRAADSADTQVNQLMDQALRGFGGNTNAGLSGGGVDPITGRPLSGGPSNSGVPNGRTGQMARAGGAPQLPMQAPNFAGIGQFNGGFNNGRGAFNNQSQFNNQPAFGNQMNNAQTSPFFQQQNAFPAAGNFNSGLFAGRATNANAFMSGSSGGAFNPGGSPFNMNANYTTGPGMRPF